MNFKDKVLLITGGTGSFGNAVLDRILIEDISEVRIFSRDEKKQDDMRHKYQKLYPEISHKIKFYIGDVRDITSLYHAIKGVNYIFHAAALKQVPSCEFFPLEAVKTNIIGTDNVLTVANQLNVEKVICLSTDKAAYPVNAMGISKSMMEKIAIAHSRTDQTKIILTRYGNVLFSRGSVIPLFIDQMAKNEKLTVTDPKMTRFIMTLKEAVDLVLYAFENGDSGDLFIQKAPSCYIGDLATALVKIFSSSSKINIIGSRHGEKLYEVLMTKEEHSKSIDMGHFYKIKADNRDLEYDKYLVTGSSKITNSNEYNSNNTHILSVNEIIDKLTETEYIKDELAKKGRML